MPLQPLLTPPIRSPEKSVDIDGFFRIVQGIFDKDDQFEHRPQEDRFLIVEDYPRERAGNTDKPLHIITWGIKRGQVAGVDRTGLERRPMRPSSAAMPRPDLKNAGYLLQDKIWREIYTVHFTVYAKSNKEANTDALRFHRTLLSYASYLGALRAYGIDIFRFAERGPDRLDTTTTDQNLYVRDLYYDVQIQIVRPTRLKTIDEATFEVHKWTPGDPTPEVSEIVLESAN